MLKVRKSKYGNQVIQSVIENSKDIFIVAKNI